MVDRGNGKKSDTYGPPGSRDHVNQGLKQQQQQQQQQQHPNRYGVALITKLEKVFIRLRYFQVA